MSKNPPKQSGLKLPPAYQARIGQDRECDSCHETKTISFSTFAPSKKAPDGVASTCRQCQGSKAGKRAAKAPKASSEKWPDAIKERAAYWAKVEELTTRMYQLANQASKTSELEQVCAALNAVTRLKDDPAGDGIQTDEELAFRTFCHVLSKRVNGWVPFGEIHDRDIIPALLDQSDRVLLLASRNSGKSSTAEMVAAWWLHRNPLDIIAVISGGATRAKRALRSVRNFIDGVPLLWPLRPNEDCLDSSTQFVVPAANGKLGASVSFSSFGIASNATGMRWNRVLLDDVEVRKDKTPNAQEVLDWLVSEVDNVLNPGGKILAIGTPQVSGLSLYGRWAKAGNWKLYRALLFEELPQDHGRGTKPQLRSRWISRWSEGALEKKRRALPEREWALHWKLDLSELATDDRPLKLRNFITISHDPFVPHFPTIIRGGGPRLAHLNTGVAQADDYFRGPSSISADSSRYLQTVAAVDPASGLAGRDECGVTVISVTSQGIGVIRCIAGVRGSSATDTLVNTASLIHQYWPHKIICEARADSLFPAQLSAVLARRGFPMTVESVQSGAKKGERIIDAIGVPLSDARLVLLESVVTEADAAETIKQITHATLDGRSLSHDDRVDSLAWAISAVAQSLAVDETDTLQMPAEQRLEELLRLPLRKGGIREGGLEARAFEISEEEERVQMKLEYALATQEEELRQGRYDPKYAAYIENLRAQVAAFRPRVSAHSA